MPMERGASIHGLSVYARRVNLREYFQILGKFLWSSKTECTASDERREASRTAVQYHRQAQTAQSSASVHCNNVLEGHVEIDTILGSLSVELLSSLRV